MGKLNETEANEGPEDQKAVQPFGLKKTNKSLVISASFARQKNAMKCLNAQWAGILWDNKDFEYCKMDYYCARNIVEELAMDPDWVFHAYWEDCKDLQFGHDGDDFHAAKVTTKYGGLCTMMRTRIKFKCFRDRLCHVGKVCKNWREQV